MQTEAGAVAFVKFYVDAVNRAWQEPSDTLLPQSADADCETCRNYQESAVSLVETKQRNTGPAVEVVEARTVSGSASPVLIDLRFRQLPVTTVDSGGQVVGKGTASEFDARAAVVWVEGRWLLRALAES